mgnify:CR=1 FL=1
MMLELPFLWLRPLYYLTSSLTLQSFLWRLLSASLPNLKPEIIKVNNQGHIKFELLVVRVEKVKVIQKPGLQLLVMQSDLLTNSINL